MSSSQILTARVEVRPLHPTDGREVGLLVEEIYRELGTRPALSVLDHIRLFETNWLEGGAGLVLDYFGRFCGYGYARPSRWHGRDCVHVGLMLRRGFRTYGTHQLLTSPLVDLARDIGRTHSLNRAFCFCRSVDTLHATILYDMGFELHPVSMLGMRHDLRTVPVRLTQVDIRLRTCDPHTEAGVLTQLAQRAFNDTANQGEPGDPSFVEFEASRRDFSPEQFLIAEAGGEPVGYSLLCHHGDDSHPWYQLAEIGVIPELRRRGIATALISRLLRWARERNTQAVTVAHFSTNPCSVVYWRVGFRPDPASTYYFHTMLLDGPPELLDTESPLN